MRFPLAKFASDKVLATSQLGKRVFAELVGELQSPSTPTLFYLDFEAVEVATMSFLRESVVAFRNYARGHVPHLYPVAANLTPGVREELHDFLRLRADALVICKLRGPSKIADAEIIGQLDGKQLATFQAVVAAGETDAVELAKQFESEEPIGTTAWNNRLAALSSKSLLIEISAGRSKRYRPVLEDIKYGS